MIYDVHSIRERAQIWRKIATQLVAIFNVLILF